MGQFMTGLVLIAIGGAFILQTQGLLDFKESWDYWRYWPLLLIGMGVAHAFDRTASVFLVVMEILQGALFLAITFHWRGLNWSHFAPLPLMILGVAWIADALVRRVPDTDFPGGDHS